MTDQSQTGGKRRKEDLVLNSAGNYSGKNINMA